MDARGLGVPALSLGDASGLWLVRTSDGPPYVVDADASAITITDTDAVHGLFRDGWLRVTLVHQPVDDLTGVLRVGHATVIGVFPPQDCAAEALFLVASVLAIEPATDDVVSSVPPRLSPLPAGVSLSGGRRQLRLKVESGVWAVHGTTDGLPVLIDLDARAILSRRDGEPRASWRWVRLDKTRIRPGVPHGVLRVGGPVTFQAAGLPGGHLTVPDIQMLRRLSHDELAELPVPAPGVEVQQPERGSGRVVAPSGKPVVLEIPGEDPLVFDQALADSTFTIGLNVPPEYRHPKREKFRLVADKRTRFLVAERELGAKRGLRVMRDGLEWAIDNAVSRHQEQVEETAWDASRAGSEASPAQSSRERHFDVEDAAARFDELVDLARAGTRVVLTRDDQPAAVLVSWAAWCALNAELTWNESAYWSSWTGGVFDHDRYAELVADRPPKPTGTPMPQRRGQS